MKLKTAFTLIELLVVIAIIGILSGLIVVAMGGMTQKATIAKAQVFSNSLRNSLMLNIIGEWKLDQIVGTIAPYSTPDSWSSGNTGTVADASGACSFSGTLKCPQLITSGCPSGNCFSFDGVDDYIDLGNISSLYPSSDLVISFWVKPTALSKSEEIFGKYNGSGGSVSSWTYGVWIYSTGVMGFGIGNGTINNFTSSVSTLSIDTWYNVVINYIGSSNVVKYYINGQYLSNKDLSLTIVPRVTTNSYFIAGEGGNRFTGLIDDVRVYNAPIPTSQIKEHYYVGLNSLLLSGQINEKDYSERINSIASNE